MTETINSDFKCEFCDSIFSRSYNLKRHVERKHAQQNVNIVQQNVNIAQQNVNIAQQNVNIVQQKVIISNTDTFACIKCTRIFKKQWICTRHEKICLGTVNPLECTYCHKLYSSRQTKSIHMKKCKETAIVLYDSNTNNNANNNTNDTINTDQPSSITNNITNNTNTNTTTNINNNINNGTINYNIIIYEDKKTKFLKDHMTNKTLRHILYNNTDETVFSKYNSELMERLENNCIRKSDKRSNYSQIHVGENKWKNIPDRKIYPEIISQIAEDMQDVVNDKFENLKSKEKLFDLLDYFIFKETADDKETERRYKRIYNLVLEEQKLFAISAARNDNV